MIMNVKKLFFKILLSSVLQFYINIIYSDKSDINFAKNESKFIGFSPKAF